MTAKVVQQTRCGGGPRRIAEPEPACDAGLERRTEAVLGTTDKEMQVTPHEPQEAVRLNQPGFRQRCGSA